MMTRNLDKYFKICLVVGLEFPEHINKYNLFIQYKMLSIVDWKFLR